ncbi:MAG: ABC transporter ATP-binding protein [Bacteroidota bacterium]
MILTKKALIYLLNLLRSLHKQIIVLLALGFCGSILSILLPVSMGKFYDLVFQDYTSFRAGWLDMWLPDGLWENIETYLFTFFGLVLVFAGVKFLERYQTKMLGEHLLYQLREQLFEAQMNLPMQVYDAKGASKYLLRWSGDLKGLQNLVLRGGIRFLLDICLMALSVWVLTQLLPELALLVGVGTGILLIGGAAWAIQKIYPASLLRRNRHAVLLAHINRRLQGMYTLLGCNRQRPELTRLNKKNDRLLEASRILHHRQAVLHVMSPVALYVLLGLGMWLVYELSKSYPGKLTRGPVLSAMLLLITLMPVFRRLVRVSLYWTSGAISLEKVYALLTPSPQKVPQQKTIARHDELSIDGVSFRYTRDGCWLLHKLSAEVKPGAPLWIYGTPGSGKSTLVRLLCGFYQPQEGEILLGAQPLSEAEVTSWRRSIAVVSEEWPLMGKTVFEAISYSRKAEKRPLARKMLNRFQQHLPEASRLDLSDHIGEFGRQLSRSQRQLLIICRALLTRKPILVIDGLLDCLAPEIHQALTSFLEGEIHNRSIVVMSHLPCPWQTWQEISLAQTYIPAPFGKRTDMVVQ